MPLSNVIRASFRIWASDFCPPCWPLPEAGEEEEAVWVPGPGAGWGAPGWPEELLDDEDEELLLEVDALGKEADDEDEELLFEGEAVGKEADEELLLEGEAVGKEADDEDDEDEDDDWDEDDDEEDDDGDEALGEDELEGSEADCWVCIV